MKTESFPSAESGSSNHSHPQQNPAAPAQGNADASQHPAATSASETRVAELQNNNGGGNGAGNQGPTQFPAGYWVQAPKNAHPDYHLPPDAKIVHVKLAAGETTFHLPANTSFDTIRIVGHDLVLIQKDGTAIVLEDAADKIPNIDVGNIEVPHVALAAAFSANGIQPAEGNQSAPPPSSGGHFDDGNGSGIGNGFGLSPLLSQEGFSFTPDPLSYPPPDFPSVAVNATVAEAVLTVSESNLTSATNGINGSNPDGALLQVSADFSRDFTSQGDATGGTVRYSLSINGGNGTASGLVDSQTGQSDVLVQNGNTIEGHVGNANGALAFTVAIDATTGVVTFTLDRAVTEPQSGSNPSATFVAIAAGLVNLTATITDGIGHSAAASIDLGTQIHITDDGPSAAAHAATVPALTLSEADLTGATNNGTDGTHPHAAATSVVGHFAGDFTDVSGADGLKSTTYALSINGGNGTASGFVDSQTGLADVLVQNGNTIEGHVGTATGALAFTITVNTATGDITFTEDRAISNNGTGAAGLSLTADLVTLTQTLVDNDGTTTSAHIDLGAKLAITDDGPSIAVNAATAPGLTLSETNLSAGTNGGTPGSTAGQGPTSATGHFGQDFKDTPGADGIKTTTYSLAIHGGNGTASGLIDSQTGQPDVLVQNGNTIEGHVGNASGALAFTITVDPTNGDVTFTEDRAIENNGSKTGVSFAADIVALTQTVTDNDGTTTSASIDLGGKLAMTDDGPSVAASGTTPALTVSETHLTAGTNGIHGTDPNKHLTHEKADFSTAFHDVSGADGIKTTTYSLSIVGGKGTPSGLIDSQTGKADVLVQHGNTIEGHVGNANGALAFTIKVNPATGELTFTEDRAVENNNTGKTGVSLAADVVTLTQTVTDNDGTTASGSVDLGPQLSITDDGPQIAVVASKEPTLTLSETHLKASTNGIAGTDPDKHLTHETGNFAKAFHDVSGADGIKSVAYSLSITGGKGTASGLIDSQTGLADVLVQHGNTIEGHVGDAKGALAFTIALDPTTGHVTFTEDRAVENNGTSTTGVSLAADIVTLTQTVTDHDGTTASASLDLGSQLAITDDGPQISVVAAKEPALTVSETHLGASTNGIDGSDPVKHLTHVTGDFAKAFHDVSGADGIKTTTYSLAIHGGNGTASGLIDSQTGLGDVLVQKGNTIEGHVGTSTGALAFTIALDPTSGQVTFTEDRAVENNGTGTTGVSLAADIVSLTQTVTDNDGTTASASLDLGSKLSITDDGPSVAASGNAPTLSVSESHLTFVSNGVNGTDPNPLETFAQHDFSGAFKDNFGADGAATSHSIAYSLSFSSTNSGLTDTQTGDPVMMKMVGSTIEGFIDTKVFGVSVELPVFTISVDSSGNVTFVDLRSVVESQAGHTVSFNSGLVTLTQTITDGDGSQASSNIDLGTHLTITDDSPQVSLTGYEPTITLQESHLPTGTDHHASDSASHSFGTGFLGFGAVFSDNFGADGAAKSGAVSYALSVGNGADSGLKDTATGTEVTLTTVGTTEVVGKDGNGDTVFTITVDQSGNVTFTLDRAIENNGTGPDGKSLAQDAVTLTQTITDGDGTIGSNHIDLGTQLAIVDDKPTITLSGLAEPTLSVHEADLQATTNGVDGSVHDGLTSSAPVSFASAFTDHGGADGTSLVSYALSVANGGATNLIDTQSGTAVTVSLVNANEIDGKDGNGDLVFQIKLDASGDVTFTLDRAVENNSGPVTLPAEAVVLTQTITDGDGTTASASLDLGSKLSITDDGPSVAASGNAPTLSVSESHLTFFTDGPFAEGSDPNFHLTHVTGDFSTAFTDVSGADGLKSTSYSLLIAGGNGTHSGLVDSQTGRDDVLVQNGNTITGYVQGTHIVAFTIELDPSTGSVRFTEDRAVTQAQDGSDPSGIAASFTSGLITLTQTLTDNDGTSASGSIDLGKQLSITDDGPQVSVIPWFEPGLVVSETHLTGFTNGGVSGSDPDFHLTHATGDFSFAFNDTVGADGLKSLTYSLSVGNVTSGLVDSQSGQSVQLVQNGAHEVDGVFTLNGKTTTVFTVTVDPFGEVTFTEERAVVQSQNGSDPSHDLALFNDGSLLLTQTITDNDGTSTSATLDLGQQLAIRDDGPSIDVNWHNAPTATLSEAYLTAATNGVDGTHAGNGTTAIAVDFSKAFVDHSGADGLKSTAYNLSIHGGNGTDSGLIDSQTGSHDILVQNGNTITGYVGNANGATAFTVTVDPATGLVTFSEDRAVEQFQNGSDPSKFLATFADNVVVLTQTITDNDGTKTSASLDLGQQLAISDDGPQISIVAANEPTLTLSEASLTSTPGDDHTAGTSPNAAATSTTAHFASVFSDNLGADGQSAHNATSYSLSLSHQGVSSGLVDTLTGQKDILIQSGNTITGYVGSYDSHSSHNIVAFTIQINPSNGDVTFTEDRSVEDNGSAISLSSGVVSVIQTITDGDGTAASASVDLGSKLSIADDTPQISLTGATVKVASVSESDLPSGTSHHTSNLTATESFGLSFSDHFGADGQAGNNSLTNHVAPVTYALSIGSQGGSTGLTDTLSGHAITLVSNGAQEIDGVVTINNHAVNVFSYRVDSSGVVTFTLDRAVDDNGSSALLPTNALTLTQTITDGDGTSTSQSLDISKQFSIGDDGPVAHNDSASTTSSQTVSENVAHGLFGASGAHDVMGADGPAGGNVVVVTSNNTNNVGTAGAAGADGVPYTVQGEYGTLTLNQDGSYSYHANADTTGLTGTVHDTFNYSIADGDGTIASATITINVNEVHPTAGAATGTVYEAGLASGSHVGTMTVTQGGTLSLSESGDTVKVTSISDATSGTVAVAQDGSDTIITGAHGTLTINDHGGYSYTLTSPETNNPTPDTFTYTATDTHGNTTTDTLTFGIHDDAPVAHADVLSAASGNTVAADAAHGLFSASNTGGADLMGADGPAGGNVVGVTSSNTHNAGTAGAAGADGVPYTVQGEYGTLTLNQDGSYSYQANADTTGLTGLHTDTFSYTIQDGDGSTATSTIAINVTETPIRPTADPATGVVYEAGLTHGSHEGPITTQVTGQLSYSEPGGTVTLTSVDNTSIPVNGVTTIFGTHGELTIQANGSYTYELTSPESNNPTPDVFTYTVTDAHGQTATNTLSFSIEDDAPVANNDAISAASGQTTAADLAHGLFSASNSGGADIMGADGPVGGNVIGVTSILTNNVGTAGGAGADGTPYTVQGEYGTLTLNQDGSYSYHASADTTGLTGVVQDTFNYSIQDGDGTIESATITINVTETPIHPTANAATGTVDEAGLANGSHQGAQTVTQGGTLSFSEAGGGTVTVTGVSDTTSGTVNVAQDGSSTTIAGAHGTLTINDNGTYSYELTSPETNNPAPDVFTYTVTDAHGQTATNTLTFGIVDDAPHIASVADITVADAANVTGTGTWTGLFGADGQNASTPIGLSMGTAPAGSSYTVTDTQTSIGGHDVSEVQVGGANPYTFYEYTVATSTGTEMFAFTDKAGNNPFFEMTVGANGSETFHLDSAPQTTSSSSSLDLTNNNSSSSYLYSTNGTTFTSSNSIPGSYEVLIQGAFVTSINNNPVQANVSAGSQGLGVNFGFGSALSSGDLLQFSFGHDQSEVKVGVNAPNNSFFLLESFDVTINGVTHNYTQFDGKALDIKASDFGLTSFTSVSIENVGFASLSEDNAVYLSSLNTSSASATAPGQLDFAVSATDGDGSTSSAPTNLDVILSASTTPILGTVTGNGELVHEAGLASGSHQGSTATTDNSVSVTFTAGADPVDVTLAASSLVKSFPGFTNLTWVTSADGHEIDGFQGSTNNPANEVVSFALTGAMSIAAGQTGTVTVTETLLHPLQGNNGQGAGDLGALIITATDHNNAAVSTSTSVNVGIADDTPVANNDAINAASGQTAAADHAHGLFSASNSGGADLMGADGLAGGNVIGVTSTLTNNTGIHGAAGADGTPYTVQGEYGTLTLNQDGSYSYHASADTTGLTGIVQDAFNYSIQDGDGTIASATITINVTETPVHPTANAATGTVDEAGLANGSHQGAQTVTQGGTLSFSEAGGTVTVTGVSDTTSGTVNVAQDGSNTTIAGAHGTLTINDNGTYSYELTSPEMGVNGVQAPDVFTYTVTDAHGQTASNTLTFGIVDDAPLFQTADHGVIANTDTVSPLTGSLSYLTGADTPVTLAFTGDAANAAQQNPWDTGQMWGNAHLMEYVSNGVLYGEAGGSNVFSVTLNAASSTYTFDLLQTLPGTTNVTDPAITTQSIANHGSYGVYSDSDGNALAVVTGYTTVTSGQNQFNFNTWFNEGHDALVSSNLHQSTINTSSNGIGVGSNNFEQGDFLRFDVGHLGDNSGTDTFKYGTTGGAPTPADANQLTFTVNVSGNKSTTIDYVVHNLDGTVTNGHYTGSDGSFTVTSDGSSNIDYVELYAASSNSSKISLTGVSEVTDSTSSLNLPFSFNTTDHDGSTSAGAFDVTLTGTQTSLDYGSDASITAFNSTNAGVYTELNDLSGHLGASATSSATNSMIGGAENDIFISQFGADTMTGGGGSDVFKLENINAHDVITDFNSGDMVDLTALLSNVPSTSLTGYVSYNANTGVLSVDQTGQSHYTPVATLDTNNNVNTHPAANSVLIAFQEHLNHQTAHAHATHAG